MITPLARRTSPGRPVPARALTIIITDVCAPEWLLEIEAIAVS